MGDEEVLQGGNVTAVVRVGETVRRAMGAWSPAVHSLLLHLEAQGFEAAPRFLGVDAQGREILSFIKGEVGHYPLPTYMWSKATLVAVARLLRRYHDATVGYVAPNGAAWHMVYPDASQHEVICHNDFAPYNIVFVNEKPCAIFDFDAAGPGPRIWDIAYAVYRFVPLSYEPDMQAVGLSNVAEQGRRLRLFCDAYGLDNPGAVPATVIRRLEALNAYMKQRAVAGDSAFQKMIDEGHFALYERDIAALRQHQEKLERALE